MSASFLDNLRRENKAKENLQYDDGAFYYFFSAFVLIVIVPLGSSLITQIFKGNKKFVINKEAAPNLMGHNIQKYLQKKDKTSRIDKTLIYKVILAIALVFLYSQIVANSGDSRELKGFDPFEILEIPKDTEDQEVIKKAFRKLSIKYHPDRNPDDPTAAAKFMQLTKAMNCLKDEESREKCEKYGSPDGSGGFSVGIALPSFLLAKENRIPVLVVFFVFILVIIPYFVLSWYSEVSKYDIDGTLVDDKKLFIAFLNENTIVKNCPRNVSVMLEFTPILPVASNQRQDMVALHNAVVEITGKTTIDPKIIKPHDLMHAYMLNIPIGASLIDDTLFILQKSPKIIEAMIFFTLKVPRYRVQNGIKNFGLRCVLTLIEFSQLFYQGLWQGDSPLQQLAVVDKATVDSVIRKKKKLPEFGQLVKDNKLESRQSNLGFLPEEKIALANEELAEFPNIDVKVELYVEDETDIRLGDIITLKVTLTRLNEDHQESEFEYLKSNRFPFNEKEKWYVFVGEETRNVVVLSEIVVFGKKTCEKKFLFPADGQGEFNFKLFVKSNGYLGLDYEENIKFKVNERLERKKYEIHPDDLAIKNEPTFFEQLTMGVKNDGNNSDDELEEESPNPKAPSPGQPKAPSSGQPKEHEIPKTKAKTE